MSDINDLKVTNFKCSEHGSIKPVPRCPKCIETERTDERSESQSPPHPHWGERLLEIAKTKNTLHSISMKTGEFSLLPEVVQVITETLTTAIQKERERLLGRFAPDAIKAASPGEYADAVLRIYREELPQAGACDRPKHHE